MRMKKYSLALAFLFVFAVGVFAGILFITPGFKKRTDVFLQDFSISEDGRVITLQTFPSGSMGFIRDIETKKIHNEIYCSFYCAFGGLNSSFGAKNCFEIELDDATEKIYFDRGEEPARIVLERDPTTNIWMAVRG